jgi:hypothetical protein
MSEGSGRFLVRSLKATICRRNSALCSDVKLWIRSSMNFLFSSTCASINLQKFVRFAGIDAGRGGNLTQNNQLQPGTTTEGLVVSGQGLKFVATVVLARETAVVVVFRLVDYVEEGKANHVGTILGIQALYGIQPHQNRSDVAMRARIGL